jgi:hypothetical protein
MTIVLPHVVHLETNVLVHFPGDAGVDAIADPRVKMGVIKDFVSYKAGKIPMMQTSFELHFVTVMNEIKRWRPPTIFKSIAITKSQLVERKLYRGFYCEPFFFVAPGDRRLVLEVCVERKKSQVLSQLERNSETSSKVFGHRPLRLSAQVQVSEQNQIHTLVHRQRELLLGPNLRGRFGRFSALTVDSYDPYRTRHDGHWQKDDQIFEWSRTNQLR